MHVLLLVIFFFVSLTLITLVIIQQGRGADMSTSLSSGAATLFGPRGSGNFMTRTTSIMAALFFIISLLLGNLNSREDISEVTQSKLTTYPAAASDIPR